MLQVEGLCVRVQGKPILKGVNLEIPAGEVHAVMGPNGSGKSTLAHVLAGRDGYEVTAGRVTFEGLDLLAMRPEDRALAGLFLAFQYPVEIPGVSNLYFMKAAFNALRRSRGEPELDAIDFLELAHERLRQVGLDESLGARALNEGFSGGEKKRNEIFQMMLLQPKVAILDETDSGLDIDALRTVAMGINAMRSPSRAMVVITHYSRLLEHVVPDKVHVMVDGAIVRTGGKEVAEDLERAGYARLEAEEREA
jgi:Fe-S cluster assembly ATP-binding protein